jgi:hypothetical protein
MKRLICSLLLLGSLAGCEMLGMESAEAVVARRDADGRAIGGACRHAGRAIEDCYVLNRKADRAAVFAGWREMNDYMRHDEVEAVPPQGVPAPAESTAKAQASAAPAAEDGASRPAAKPKAKKTES